MNELKQIYDKYYLSVFNLSIYYVQNVEDAEEITQDVFLKIYKKIGGFRGDSSIKTWIHKITVNTALDFLKTKNSKKNKDLSILQYPEETENIYDVIAQEQKWAEEIKLLFEAINQLPENQKNVIILMKLQENSQKETAEILEISQKAVESLYQRAKKNLFEILSTTKPKDLED